MLKTIAFVRRKPQLTRQAFRDHYERVHAALAVRCLPYLHRYVRNHVQSDREADALGIDCISTFWYATEADLRRTLDLLDSDIGEELRRDELDFMDKSHTGSCQVEERILVEPGGGGVAPRAKAILWIPAESSAREPEPMVDPDPELAGWIENTVVSRTRGAPPAVGRVIEIWMNDAERLRTWLALHVPPESGATGVLVQECETSVGARGEAHAQD